MSLLFFFNIGLLHAYMFTRSVNVFKFTSVHARTVMNA